jgi:DNA polymerase-3 subunit delta
MAKNLGFEEIQENIQKGVFFPVYLFQGEEAYYIDQLTNLLTEKALDDSERDFNQYIFYGMDSDTGTIINTCKRFPMMSERQLVIVKEAQGLKNIDDLIHYVKRPLSSTVLVINVKHGKLDGRKKLSGEIAKTGIVFESKKLYDNQIPPFITAWLRKRKVKIDMKPAQMLADYLGNDLSKLTNEMEKLILLLPKENPEITSELIEHNIGISKDYNNFELQKALANKDILKSNRIALYFEQNPKNNPIILTLASLFSFFSNLMICHYEKDKSKQNLMAVLGFHADIQIVDYMTALSNYKPLKTMQIISLIRDCDARSKGVNNASVPPESLLKELVYKILH